MIVVVTSILFLRNIKWLIIQMQRHCAYCEVRNAFYLLYTYKNIWIQIISNSQKQNVSL
jgi:hypothetical protein